MVIHISTSFWFPIHVVPSNTRWKEVAYLQYQLFFIKYSSWNCARHQLAKTVTVTLLFKNTSPLRDRIWTVQPLDRFAISNALLSFPRFFFCRLSKKKKMQFSLEPLMFKKQLLPSHQVFRKPEASLHCFKNSLSKYFLTERSNATIAYAGTHYFPQILCNLIDSSPIKC